MKETRIERSHRGHRRLPPYPAYRDSGLDWLGSLPTQWKVSPLKRLFVVLNGSTPQSGVPDYWDGPIPGVTPEDLGDLSEPEIRGSRRGISLAGYRSCGTSMAPAGSLVLSTRAPIGHLGIAAMPLCTNQGCRTLVSRGAQVEKYYFYLLLAARPDLESFGQGSTFRELATSKLEDFRLAIPPEPEQRAIATFLDRETAEIDALVAKKERLIELLREKRSALITRAVTKGLDPSVPMKDSGVEWLGRIPEHWRTLPLKLMGELQAGAGFPDEEQGVLTEEIPFFKVGDMAQPGNEREMAEAQHFVSRATAKRLRARVLPANTVVFAKVGAALKLNKRRLLVRPSCIDNNMMGFVPTQCDPRWAVFWLSCVDLGERANPGAVPSVNEGQMRDIPAIAPPPAEQSAIADFLLHESGRFDELIGRVRAGIARVKELRAALISEAVTGKINVRDAH